MKYTILTITILLCLARLTHASDTSKTILVDQSKFSKLYPAVWFSPSTGEIAPLKERSEVPPGEKYEIWIEPSDPEFGYNPDQKPKDVGFALIGKGSDAFNNPTIPKALKLELKITHLMRESQAQEQLVFYCQAKTSTCLIMVTSIDSEEQVIQFEWRLLTKANADQTARPIHIKNVAAIVTEYRHNSHADIIVSRLLQTDTLDGKGKDSPLKLTALYTDQLPKNDTSRMLAASHRFPILPTIGDTLTQGTNTLAVDGVLLIGEHGDYPRSDIGSKEYPKRRFWDETIAVFKTSNRVVPVFMDKHLAITWDDAKFIYDQANAMQIPLMAGSSVPGTWRHPAADVRRGAPLAEIVAITYGSTDAYGFHALEVVQALAEQRKGGETGVSAVQCLTGDAVWKARDEGLYDAALFQAAWDRLPLHRGKGLLENRVKKPILFIIEYKDGLRAHVLELNGAAVGWTAAWRYHDTDDIESTHFWTQEGRPGMHFTLLLNGIEDMILTGKPAWPVERTLMSTGLLDALLTSRANQGNRVPTPHLEFTYQPTWRWQQPPPPPPHRPWAQQ